MLQSMHDHFGDLPSRWTWNAPHSAQRSARKVCGIQTDTKSCAGVSADVTRENTGVASGRLSVLGNPHTKTYNVWEHIAPFTSTFTLFHLALL